MKVMLNSMHNFLNNANESLQVRSFVKIKPLLNGEITLWFTDVGNSCPDCKSFTLQLCLLMLFVK